MKGWTPQAVEQASKPIPVPATAPNHPTKGKTQPTQDEAATADETPPLKTGQQYFIGPYQLQVALGTHYPGRVRAVLTGEVAGFAHFLAYLQAYQP